MKDVTVGLFGKRAPMEKAERRAFVRGYAAAAAELASTHGQPGLADSLLAMGGLTLFDLERAGVESFDLDPLKDELLARSKKRSRP